MPDSVKQRLEKEKQEREKQGTEKQSTGKLNASRDDLTIRTDDGRDISAAYSYNSGQKETLQPLVILVHQFNQSKEEWKQDFIDSLLAAGYKVLAYDIRGHGKSSKQDGDLTNLLSDPDQAPKDITAVFGWAKREKGIDSSRIAVIGTSIGGNLALYAKYKLNAKTVIAVSNSKETFEKFIGFDERMMGRPMPRVSSVFLISGSKDGDHEQGQRWILENMVDAPKEIKVYDSAKHGKFLIEEFPEINSLMISWLKKYL